MAGTGGTSVERVSVQVVPDTSKLRRELQKVTKQLEKSLSIRLKVEADIRPALRAVLGLDRLTDDRSVAISAYALGGQAATELDTLTHSRTAEIVPTVQAAGVVATTATLAILAGGVASAFEQSQAGALLVEIMRNLALAVSEAAVSVSILTQTFGSLAEVGLAAMAVSLTLIDSIISGAEFQVGLTTMLVGAAAAAAALSPALVAVGAELQLLGAFIAATMMGIVVTIAQPVSAAGTTVALESIKSRAQELTETLPGLARSLETLGKVLSGVDVSAAPFLEKIGPVLSGILDSLAEKIPGLGGVFETLTGVFNGVSDAADGIASALDLASNAMDTFENVSALAEAAQNGFMAASYGAEGATYKNTVATNAQRIAQVAGAGASKVATAAQWLFNAAITANPIGLIILAIVALVAALVWFFTQTELGKSIFEGFMSFITDAITVAQDIFQAVWEAISGFFTAAWENVIQPVLEGIGAVFTWLFENIIAPIVSGILLYVGIWAAIFTWLWETILQPVFAAIGVAFQWIWDNVFKPVGDFIMALIDGIGVVFTWLWENAIKPALDGIGIAFQWIWDNVFKPVGDFIMGIINGIGTVFSWLWNSAVKPAIDALGAAFQFFWNNIIKPIGDFIKGAFEAIGTTAEKVFSAVSTAVSNAFGALVGIVKGPINAVIDLINGMIGAINKVKITIPDWVPEWGGQTFGINIPKIPRLALGATVLPQPGGTLAVLAEAGRAETVVDTGKMNALMDLVIRRDSGRNPGMNEFTQENHFYERAEDPRILMRIAGAEFQTMTAGVLV